MKKKIPFILCLLFISILVKAQTSGDYRSIGTVDLNSITNWETFSLGSWQAATLIPNGNVTAGNTITIQAGNTWGNASSSTIPAGASLIMKGTAGTFGAGLITLNGVYVHFSTTTASNIYLGMSIQTGSTFIYRASSSVVPTVLMNGRTFYNFSLDTDGTTVSTPGTTPGISTAVVVNGDLTVNKWTLNLSNNTSTFTLGGNADISGSVVFTVKTLTIAVGKTLTLNSGCTLSTTASATLTINGTFDNKSAVVIGTLGSIVVNGTYKHNSDANTIPSTRVTYATNSTIEVTGIVNNAAVAQLPASCYNVLWNSPSQTAAAINTFTPNATTTINGNLTIQSTGAGAIYMGGGGTARTLNVLGNLTISGGELRLVNEGGTVPQTCNVTGDVTVSSGKFLISNNTNTGAGVLNISGSLNHNGGNLGNSATATSGIINFISSADKNMSSVGLSNAVILNINKPSNKLTLITDLMLDAKSILNVEAGTFDANNQSLTLKSTASGTASIGAILGTLSNASNITTQVYIPAGRRTSRFLSHPFSSALTMSSLIDNIYITGGNYLTGFDSTGTQSPSSFWFDNGINQAWTAFASTTDASWTPYRGIRVLVRGDRSQPTALTGGNPSPNAVTLDMSGAVNTGLQNISLPFSGTAYSVLGNPYPAPVDLGTRLFNTTNIGNQYWVWDANAGISVGAYVVKTVTPLIAYNLPMNAAFVVQPTTSTSIAFIETDKQATAISLFRTNTLSGQLELEVLYNNYHVDNMFIRFNTASSDNKEMFDGEKLLNPEVNFYALSADNKKLSLDTRPFVDNKIIPLGFTATAVNSFKIKVTDYGLLEDTYLRDKFLNALIKLDATTEYSFNVTVDPASQGQNRFELVMRTNSALPTTILNVTAAQKNGGIEITWETANETNMSNYEIEESADGISFNKATTVAAKNATSNSYTWYDAVIINGDNFYRIKSVEKNGGIKYSNIVKVKIGGKTPEFTVFPNPVKGGIVSLQMSNVEKGVYTVKVFNNIGQELAAKLINHNGGSATQTLNLGKGLATGNYNMQISNGTTVITKTIIVE